MNHHLIQTSPNLAWAEYVSDISHRLNDPIQDHLIDYLVMTIRTFEHTSTELPIYRNIDWIQIDPYHTKSNQIKQFADTCLINSGLFPRHFLKTPNTFVHYISFSQQGYKILAQRQQLSIYQNIVERFISLIDILLLIRTQSYGKPLLNPKEAEIIWRKTKSQYAKEIAHRTKNML